MSIEGEEIKSKLVELALNRLEKSIGDYEPENIHWLSSNKVEVDESEDRCYNCAKKKSKKLTNVDVDGSWNTPQETDTCAHCQDCGKLLAYSLTECGVESELDHYLYKTTKIDVAEKEEAYHLQAILECYKEYDVHKKRILELAKLILKHNFWYKIKNLNKLQCHCNTCGKTQHLWCCETFLDFIGLKEQSKLPDNEDFYFNRLYLCAWHKGVWTKSQQKYNDTRGQ